MTTVAERSANIPVMLVISAWSILFMLREERSLILGLANRQQLSSSESSLPSPPGLETVVTADPFSLQKNDVAAFYNIYISPQQNETRDALDIIREQVEQVSTSSVNITLFFNTIGNPWLRDDPSLMSSICDRYRVQCVHMEHYAEGMEEVTLQKMHNYCHEFDSHQVLYFHNKGSFHPAPYQTTWRQNMMKAITHDDCLVTHKDECSTCGLVFQPIWVFFYPGNFFSARCDYVKRLRPPLLWKEVSNNTTWIRPREFTSVIFTETISTLGTDRIASEHWIGSHPSIQPCDLSPHALISKWNYGRGKWFPWTFEFHTAAPPRHPLLSEWVRIREKPAERVLKDLSSRLRDYNLLGGRLYRWSQFYPGEFPAPDSWIWSYFPDGTYWQNLLSQHNGNVNRTLFQAWAEIPPSSEWLDLVKSSPPKDNAIEFFERGPNGNRTNTITLDF